MSDIEYVGRGVLMKFLIIATGVTILLLILVLITTFQSKADINKLKELNQEVQSLKEAQEETSGRLEMLYNITQTVTEDVGVVSYWSFDKETITDNTAKNLYGQGDATLKNATYTAEGKKNGGISFDGVKDYIELPKNSADFNQITGAIGFWIYPELGKAEQSFSGLIHYRKGNCCSDYFIIRLIKGKNGDYLRILAEKNNTATLSVTTKEATIKEDEWNHILIQQDGNGIEIYVDGTKQELTGENSNEWFGQHYPATRDFTIGDIGSWADNANISTYYKGRIDELKAWNRPLTTQEIKNVMTI